MMINERHSFLTSLADVPRNTGEVEWSFIGSVFFVVFSLQAIYLGWWGSQRENESTGKRDRMRMQRVSVMFQDSLLMSQPTFSMFVSNRLNRRGNQREYNSVGSHDEINNGVFHDWSHIHGQQQLNWEPFQSLHHRLLTWVDSNIYRVNFLVYRVGCNDKKIEKKDSFT